MFRMKFVGLIIFSAVVLSCSLQKSGDEHRHMNSENKAVGIFGGVAVENTDPIARSSVALVEGDGEQVCSGTLIAPDVVVTAAHCFTSFSPFYVSFGVEVAQKSFWTDDLSDRTKFPNFREIISRVIHPDYDTSVTGQNEEELRPANDIALAFIADGAPEGFSPANVVSPDSAMGTDITIAGFGAHPEYDPLDPEPPLLRRVDTFIGTILQQSKMLKDGPNPGKGSCVRDSGGSIYLRANGWETPVVVGNVVSGPFDCSEGIGYNTDIRYYVPWIEATAGVSLTKVTVETNCNNGVVDSGEVCDGDTKACREINPQFVSGTAVCSNNCLGYNTEACEQQVPVCGDSQTEGAEVCDGDSVPCPVYDGTLYVGGTAICNGDCDGYNLENCVPVSGSDSCFDAACRNEEQLSIPDNSPLGTVSEIVVQSFDGVVESVMVSVEIVHTYRGDIRVRLVSPSGAEAVLFDRTGGGADNLSLNLTLDDFDSATPLGSWKLIVSDHASRDTGSLSSWSLRFTKKEQSICGNGEVETEEVCDGGEYACALLNSELYSGGIAYCHGDCRGYDFSNCQVAEMHSSCVTSACRGVEENLPIPDNRSTGISSVIHVDHFEGTVENVLVEVNIDHTYRGDLFVSLTSPQGTVKVLHNKTGGSADDLALSQVVSEFQGEVPTGDFILFISDNAAQDVGTLLDWSIKFI